MWTPPGGEEELRSEINVTPLVDVVLVLLIIFMVVTPLLSQDVPVELPLAGNAEPSGEPEPLTLTVSADGALFLDGEPMAGEGLVATLRRIYASRSDKTLFVRADRALSYARVVDVLDDCREAGVATIGLVTRRAETDP